MNRWKKGKKKRKSAKRKKEKIWREQTRVTRFYFFGRVAYTRRLSLNCFFFQEKSLFTLYYLVRRVFSWTHAKQKQKVKARIELSKRCVLHASFNALLLLLVLLLSPSVEEISLCEYFNFRIKKERDPLERSKNTNEEEEEKIETSSNLTTRFLFLFFEITSKTH